MLTNKLKLPKIIKNITAFLNRNVNHINNANDNEKCQKLADNTMVI